MAGPETKQPERKEPTVDVNALSDTDIKAADGDKKEPTISEQQVDVDAVAGISNAQAVPETKPQQDIQSEPVVPNPASAEAEEPQPQTYQAEPEVEEEEPARKPSKPTNFTNDESELDPEETAFNKDLIEKYAAYHNATFSQHLSNQIEDVAQDEQGNSLFKLKSGGALKFLDQGIVGYNQDQSPQTTEMIQLVDKEMDADSAASIVEAAQSKGWDSINVHGSQSDKEQLWIAAQNAGLEVDNFKPRPEQVLKWEQEGLLNPNGEEAPKSETPGVAEAEPKSRFTDMAPKTEESAEETPEAEAPEVETAAEETPEATAPEAETPKESSFVGNVAEKSAKAVEAKKETETVHPDQQTALMSSMEKQIAKWDTEIAEMKESGQDVSQKVEDRENIRRSVEKMYSKLQDNQPMGVKQFEAIKEEYKNGNSKRIAEITSMNVKLKNPAEPKTPVETADVKVESNVAAKPAAKDAPKI